MKKNILLAESFVDSLDNLGKKDRKTVWKKISEIAENGENSSYSIHSLDRTDCDESFRSARINRDIRVILSHQGDNFVFLYADHHDDAYNWAEGKYLNKNSFGAVYIKDNNIQLKEQKDMDPFNSFMFDFDSRPALLEDKGITLSDLEKLDIDRELAKHILEIKDEGDLIDSVSTFPSEIAEGILDIVTGSKSITQVYNELVDETVDSNSSIAEALQHKNSKRRFYLVKDAKELEYIINQDIDKWKLFLHPLQDSVVKMNFNGPALIEGGPGTGKTVVGIHRFIYLATNIYTSQDSKILFCTYSRKLAKYIEDKIIQLAEQKETVADIEINGVDSLIHRYINQYNLSDKTIDMDKLERIMEDIYIKTDMEEDFDFYKTEYHEVIQRYHIRTLEDYLEVSRKGRNKKVGPAKREKSWIFFKKLLERKTANNLVDFEDRAYLVYEAVMNGVIKAEYDSIIIDEAQDLSPIKLKLLGALVKTSDNNIFLLSDKNQRIFKLDSWKQDTGLNIVGRTHYLTLNYRTTKQIREFADNQFINTDNSSRYMREYKSVYLGPEPVTKVFTNKTDQYRFLVKVIKRFQKNEVNDYEIGIISPTDQREIAGALRYAGIKYSYLKGDTFPKPGTGVGISTIQGAKGLEFKVVIIPNYNEINSKLKKEVKDEWYNQQKIRQYECLKYVACTRARDELVITYSE